MARFKTGAEAIHEASKNQGSSKDFAPQITWKGGETKYIQFITPLDEVPTVEMYQFVNVGTLPSGDTKYRSFISPRDPALLAENPDARDYLAERGMRPKRRQFALAVELDPTTEKKGSRVVPTGFSFKEVTLKGDDGSERLVPAVGVICQSHIFFGWFATFDQDQPIEDFVFKVTRRGNDQNTAYDSTAMVGFQSLDLTELMDKGLPINFEEYLDELADEERMRMYVEDKPSDWVFDKYATRGKAKSQPRARYNTEEEPEAEEQPRARRTRFAEIKEAQGQTRD